MPTYIYECYICERAIEIVCPIDERPETIPCVHAFGCPGLLRQIIVAPAIQVDTAADIPWLDEFARTRKEARYGGKPIQTRAQYKQYLKEYDLRPCGDGINLSEV